MTKWDYRTVLVNRTGTAEDAFLSSGTWTYTPWQVLGTSPGNEALAAGLHEVGGEGWELVGMLPTDIWVEGTRAANASHGERTISFMLFFKRALPE